MTKTNQFAIPVKTARLGDRKRRNQLRTQRRESSFDVEDRSSLGYRAARRAALEDLIS